MEDLARAGLLTIVSLAPKATKMEHLFAALALARLGWHASIHATLSVDPKARQMWLELRGWTIEIALLVMEENDSNGYQEVLSTVLPTRLQVMAKELHHGITNTSGDEMLQLAALVAGDVGSALGRRVTNLVQLVGNLIAGTVSEGFDLAKAYADDRAVTHLAERLGAAKDSAAEALTNGATFFGSLIDDMVSNPAEAAPRLLMLVLASVASSGGLDGNGGAPDMDIPLMGIGAHRSPFTHSIIVGSLLEAALMLLTRTVVCVHKNLPLTRDPLWDGIAGQSVGILNAAGKGASIGIAYHLMVDAVVQPGAYHGLPFDMPIEAHQTILAANSVAEATAGTLSPGDDLLVDSTPEILAAHQHYRSTRMTISEAVK